MTSYDVGPFRAEGRADQIKTAMGAAGLVGLGEPVLSGLARWATPETLHRAIRLWSQLTSRFLNLQMNVGGLENVDTDRSYVVAPLHEGFADPLLLARLPLRLRYLVRDELFEWRHLGRFLKSSGQLEVAPESSDRGVGRLLSDSRGVLDGGESLVVFPQGSILGIEVAFTRGAFVLADRLSRPLLPIVITGTHRVWEHPYHPTLRYGQHVEMTVLPPLPIGEAVVSMQETETTMKTMALENTRAPARRFDPERDGYWDGYSFEIDPRFPELSALIASHRSSLSPA